ncbi:MAG: M36 family metallopeptidase, partial [Psychrosphaera sp.]|nr:M36 family metallopeptidase [Psychrosphaera sp.]
MGAKHGVTTTAIAQAELKYVHDTGRGGLISKYQQMANGIEVHNRQFNVLMNQDMELVATTGYFSKAKLPRQPLGVQFKYAVTDAINVAISDMGGEQVSMTKLADKGKFQNFKVQGSDSPLSVSDDVRSKKVYYPGKKALLPAYYIEVIGSEKGSTSSQGYSYVISAKDGTVLSRHSMTFNEAFTYKVFADATAPYKPYDSPMGNELSPHPTGIATDVITEVQQPMNDLTIENTGISTNDPWLPDGATETTGNNVDAYADLTSPDGFNAPTTDDEGNEVPGDVRPQVTSAGTFDYQFTQTDAHDTATNTNAAIVNLFYVNNYLHDVYYNHGFDEASGNAQMDNYGRGGVDGDPLHVEGQDSNDINNANMTIPTDGGSPRMQMYLWVEGNNLPLTIGSQEEVDFLNSSFSPGVYNLAGTLVRYEDGTDPINDACESPTNADAMAGMVVIIDRGGCDFSAKAGRAQDAGAVGVLIANNDADNPDQLVNMGAGDNPPNITIPVLSISYNTGVATYAEMANGSIEVSVASDESVRDGTMDNPIIEHEWGHYISGRLTVGLYNNNQGWSMGEGWGDFIALMSVSREEDRQIAGNEHFEAIYNDGGYALSNGGWTDPYYFGLRRAPYTTNMEFNALTFKHIQDGVALPDTHPINTSEFGMGGGFNAEVHASGEIWASVLWESYVALLNRDGKSFDESQGQMMDYIVAAMKLQPTSPTYTEARDALLAVAIANNMDDYTLMRAAFAKRGMGPGAVSPARNDPGFDGTGESQGHAGVVEDFTTEYSAVELTDLSLDTAYVGLEGAFCDSDDILDVGETAAVRFTIRNSGTAMQHNFKAMVSSTADVTFGNGGVVTFENMHVWNDVKNGLVEMTLNSADVDSTIPITISFMAEDDTTRVPADIEATVTVNRDIAKDDRRVIEGFETLPTVWTDWSQHKIGAANSGHFVGLDDWTVIDVGFGTGNTMMGPDGQVQTDISLMSPMVTVGASGEFAMDFNHYYEFEISPADGDTPAV